MGIDVYMHWDLMTDKDHEAQGGYRVNIGDQGYLREAYHGEPYATRLLVKEAFEEGAPVHIPARVLRERLPSVMKVAMKREREVYKNRYVNEDSEVVQSFVSFVELAEHLEARGEKPRVYACW